MVLERGKRAFRPITDYGNYVGMTSFVFILLLAKYPLQFLDTQLDWSTRRALENAIAKLAKG